MTPRWKREKHPPCPVGGELNPERGNKTGAMQVEPAGSMVVPDGNGLYLVQHSSGNWSRKSSVLWTLQLVTISLMSVHSPGPSSNDLLSQQCIISPLPMQCTVSIPSGQCKWGGCKVKTVKWLKLGGQLLCPVKQ